MNHVHPSPQLLDCRARSAATFEVTDSKRTGEVLVANERRYRNLFEHSPVPLLESMSHNAFAVAGLQKNGVHDLRTHFDPHHEAVIKSAPLIKILEVSASDGAMLLSMHDSGHDMVRSPATIFESFYTTKPRGVGLGMTVCNRNAEAHEDALRWPVPPGVALGLLCGCRNRCGNDRVGGIHLWHARPS